MPASIGIPCNPIAAPRAYITVTNASILGHHVAVDLLPRVGRPWLPILTIGAARDLEEARSAKVG